MDVYVVEKTGGTLEIDKIIVNKTKDDKGNATTGKVDIGGDASKNGFNFVNTYVRKLVQVRNQIRISQILTIKQTVH